jgi:hypothetical protein
MSFFCQAYTFGNDDPTASNTYGMYTYGMYSVYQWYVYLWQIVTNFFCDNFLL